jgi:type I restriction enzyme, S subunit
MVRPQRARSGAAIRWIEVKYDQRLRYELGAVQRGAVMPGLNMGLIKGAQVKLPPISLQTAFVESITRVECDQARQFEHVRGIDELFASLQQQAFQGAL